MESDLSPSQSFSDSFNELPIEIRDKIRISNDQNFLEDRNLLFLNQIGFSVPISNTSPYKNININLDQKRFQTGFKHDLNFIEKEKNAKNLEIIEENVELEISKMTTGKQSFLGIDQNSTYCKNPGLGTLLENTDRYSQEFIDENTPCISPVLSICEEFNLNRDKPLKLELFTLDSNLDKNIQTADENYQKSPEKLLKKSYSIFEETNDENKNSENIPKSDKQQDKSCQTPYQNIHIYQNQSIVINFATETNNQDKFSKNSNFSMDKKHLNILKNDVEIIPKNAFKKRSKNTIEFKKDEAKFNQEFIFSSFFFEKKKSSAIFKKLLKPDELIKLSAKKSLKIKKSYKQQKSNRNSCFNSKENPFFKLEPENKFVFQQKKNEILTKELKECEYLDEVEQKQLKKERLNEFKQNMADFAQKNIANISEKGKTDRFSLFTRMSTKKDQSLRNSSSNFSLKSILKHKTQNNAGDGNNSDVRIKMSKPFLILQEYRSKVMKNLFSESGNSDSCKYFSLKTKTESNRTQIQLFLKENLKRENEKLKVNCRMSLPKLTFEKDFDKKQRIEKLNKDFFDNYLMTLNSRTKKSRKNQAECHAGIDPFRSVFKYIPFEKKKEEKKVEKEKSKVLLTLPKNVCVISSTNQCEINDKKALTKNYCTMVSRVNESIFKKARKLSKI